MDYATMHETESAIRPTSEREGADANTNGNGCHDCGDATKPIRDVEDTDPTPTSAAPKRDVMPSDDNSALWFVIGILIVLILLKSRGGSHG